jgi:hypothetical protein
MLMEVCVADNPHHESANPKANKAREAALMQNPKYRLYEERQQIWRQAASQKKVQIEDANVLQAAAPTEPDHPPCDERQRLEREALEYEIERDS